MRASTFLLLFQTLNVLAASGDWPEPRQNQHLTGIQPTAGAMTQAPRILARFDLGLSRPKMSFVSAAGGDPDFALSVTAGALYCFDREGKQRWVCHPPGLNFTQVITTEDLDGDGKMEVFLTAGRPTQPFGAVALVSLADGMLLWRYDVEPMSYSWNGYADDYLQKSGTKQIVVLVHAYPPDPKNGYIALFDFPKPGALPEPVWRFDFDSYTCFPSLLRTDLDGDGKKEMAVETHSKMWLFDAPTGHVKQFITWDVSPANVRSYGKVEFTDLNGDGREDFYCIANFAQHHEVLLNEGGQLRRAWGYGWNESVTTVKVASVWPDPPYADLDGDGNLELAVSMYNSENEHAWLIRIYDAATGRLKFRQPGSIAVAMADLDSDGTAEIAAHQSTDPTKSEIKGAAVLKAATPEWQVLWQDPTATFSEAVHDATGISFVVARGTEQRLLHLEGQFSESPKPAPPPRKKELFTSVPAIQAGPFPELLAADLLGDEKNEILVYREPNVEVLRPAQDGTLEISLKSQSDCLPVLTDLDGDGRKEMVTGKTDPTAPPVLEARTPSKDSSLLWRSVFPPPDRAGLPHSRKLYMRQGRFTGGQTPDLYVWAGTPLGRGVVLSGKDGRRVWEKGEMKGIERYWAPTVNHASVIDFNQDGAEDLVFTAPDYYCVDSGPTGEALLGPLFPPEIFNQPSQGLYTFPAILESASGEPTVCLVNGHYFQSAMSLHAKPYWYQLPPCGEHRSSTEAFLRTREGEWLMGYGRQNGKFTCLNVSDGSIRWELDVEATCSDALSCDVDGDGNLEFVFGTSHGGLYAAGDGGSRERPVWRMELPGPAGPVIAADVTGDGSIEIMVPAGDGQLYVLGN